VLVSNQGKSWSIKQIRIELPDMIGVDLRIESARLSFDLCPEPLS